MPDEPKGTVVDYLQGYTLCSPEEGCMEVAMLC